MIGLDSYFVSFTLIIQLFLGVIGVYSGLIVFLLESYLHGLTIRVLLLLSFPMQIIQCSKLEMQSNLYIFRKTGERGELSLGLSIKGETDIKQG